MIKQGLNFLNMPQKVAPGAVLIDFEAIFDRGWRAKFGQKSAKKMCEIDASHFHGKKISQEGCENCKQKFRRKANVNKDAKRAALRSYARKG